MKFPVRRRTHCERPVRLITLVYKIIRTDEVCEPVGECSQLPYSERPAIPDETNAPHFTSVATNIVVNTILKAPQLQSWKKRDVSIIRSSLRQKSPARKFQPRWKNFPVELRSHFQVDGCTRTLGEIRLRRSRNRRWRISAHPVLTFTNTIWRLQGQATLLLTMLDHIGLRGYPRWSARRGDIEADPKFNVGLVRPHDCGAAVPANLRSSVGEISFVRCARSNSVDRSDFGKRSLARFPRWIRGFRAHLLPDHAT